VLQIIGHGLPEFSENLYYAFSIKNVLKYFQKYFSFRGDIHELGFFPSDSQVTRPGNQLNSGSCDPEIN